MILKLEDVGMKFDSFAALSNLTFQVEQNEVFGIAGPNGAGKTTLFNVMTGILSGSGKVFFNGMNINQYKPHQICNLGLARTFQVPLLFSTLSVFQNVKVGVHFGMRPKKNETEKIKEMIAFVGLKRKENTIADNLSLLDKKLTMLATALGTNPKILMLDEPVGGLCETDVDMFLKLIKKINQELGITIIVIEHLMKFIVELCDRLMILNNGEKVIIGPPVEVTQDSEVIEIYLGSEKEAYA
jgi:branched-chain amino acid transport system ATP-binding protein